ncbi:MAG: hypothetical protein ACKVHU_06370 [Acidimicrobiales bacterium]|jgi:hypothetical protein
MHPIERLRYVARAGDVDQALLVREAASALGSLGDDPGHLMVSSRRMVDRHQRAGAMWSLAARVLTSNDPMRSAWAFLDELDEDKTAIHVARSLPASARVCLIGWPDLAAEELSRRGDVEVRVIDAYGEGAGLVRRLEARNVDVVEVTLTGLGAAASTADVALVEAAVCGATGIIAAAGSLAVAATCRAGGGRVIAVVGAGRALPERMFEAARSSLDSEMPWEDDEEFVPMELIDAAVGPTGEMTVADLCGRADCQLAPELLRPPI